MLDLPRPIFHTFAFLLGAIVGSFLNVVIVRIPEGESIVRPRSKCPKCGDAIPSWLNIPILSWIILRGRCRRCKQSISIRYPLVELLTALLFLAAAMRFRPTLALLAGWLMIGGLIAVTFIDLDIWEIPDEISLPGIVVGAALRPFAFPVAWYDGILGALIGAAALGAVRFVGTQVFKKEAMGLGDLKLIAMIGAFLGPMGLLPTILVASVVGSVVGIALLLIGKAQPGPPQAQSPPDAPAETAPPAEVAPPVEPSAADDEDHWVPPKHAVPFGPFLALGGMTELLIGPALRMFWLGHP
ncbi:MAG: prepilin peptidase [Deltaproteobacteria bacterium]|nr:prepilin peptidase [Deltaproteobacteria bacterium]